MDTDPLGRFYVFFFMGRTGTSSVPETMGGC